MQPATDVATNLHHPFTAPYHVLHSDTGTGRIGQLARAAGSVAKLIVEESKSANVLL
jgi:hypothetical protein